MLPELRIASPCTADWNQMAGDERVRYCAQCRLNVYNFSAMTTPEVESILGNRNGRLCARLYRRTDGTILTQDCPVGFRATIRRVSRIAGAALTAAMSVAAAAQTSSKTTLAPLVLQQAGGATVSVTVMDQSGAVIQNAKVALVENLFGRLMEGRTDPEGVFRQTGLPPGTYTMTVKQVGFAKWQIPLTLRADQVEELRATLEVGGSSLLGVVVQLGAAPPESQLLPNVVPDLLPEDSPARSAMPNKNIFSRLKHKLGF